MYWSRRHARGRPPHPDVLTPAEWRVLELVRQGHPNAEIAVRLGIGLRTVKAHVTSILAKTDMPDRYALAQWEGEPAAPSRAALGRGFAWPLAGWFTAGTAVAGTKVAAAAVGSVVFVASLFAVYGFFFAQEAEETEEARGPERIVPEPPVTSVIDVGHIEEFEVRDVHTFALVSNSAEHQDSVIRVDDERHIQRTDEQIRDLHDPPFGFFVVRSAPAEVVALVGHDPSNGCALLSWGILETAERASEWGDAADDGEDLAGVLRDPCHGSTYSIDGTFFFGPSPSDLSRYVVEVTPGGRVLVDLSDVSPGDRTPLSASDATPPSASQR